MVGAILLFGILSTNAEADERLFILHDQECKTLGSDDGGKIFNIPRVPQSAVTSCSVSDKLATCTVTDTKKRTKYGSIYEKVKDAHSTKMEFLDLGSLLKTYLFVSESGNYRIVVYPERKKFSSVNAYADAMSGRTLVKICRGNIE